MRKNKRQKSQANYLDAVPVRAVRILWHVEEDGAGERKVVCRSDERKSDKCEKADTSERESAKTSELYVGAAQSDESPATLVILDIENKGAFNKIAQTIFKKPKVSHVHLDEFGSFIWLQINGERTVHDIALSVKEKFGEDAEPLYPRIIKFMQIMKSYDFIELRGI